MRGDLKFSGWQEQGSMSNPFFSYRVIYNFSSDNESALPVLKGDIVLGAEQKPNDEGKWILVQSTKTPFPHGYVPSNFLERIYNNSSTREEPEQKKLPFAPLVRTILSKRNKDAFNDLIKEHSEEISPLAQDTRWQKGMEHYDTCHYLDAIVCFKSARSMTSKTVYNIAMSYTALRQFPAAIFYFSQAIAIDAYFAVAYFSRGNCYSYAGDSFQAILDFTSTLDLLQHNKYIDYEPIGLPYLLQRSTVLWNRAICFADCKMIQRAIYDVEEVKKSPISEKQVQQTDTLLKLLKKQVPGGYHKLLFPEEIALQVGSKPGRFSAHLSRSRRKINRPTEPPPIPGSISPAEVGNELEGREKEGEQEEEGKKKEGEQFLSLISPVVGERPEGKRLSRSISNRLPQSLPPDKRLSRSISGRMSTNLLLKKSIQRNASESNVQDAKASPMNPLSGTSVIPSVTGLPYNQEAKPKRPPRKNIHSKVYEFVEVNEELEKIAD